MNASHVFYFLLLVGFPLYDIDFYKIPLIKGLFPVVSVAVGTVECVGRLNRE